jgi:ribosome-associated translation inhibitor RaiA
MALQHNDPTRLDIRTPHTHVDEALRDWVHERLGRHLGKFASQIERIDVRFGDENGPKGGIDRDCLVHVVVNGLPPIAVEVRGETDREAFDLAAGRAERATKHALQRHGFTAKRRKRDMANANGADDTMEQMMPAADGGDGAPAEDSLYGRREGRGVAQLEAARAMVGDGHTASRNTKLNTAGMTYDLEDSMSGRPSRKSTRRSKNGVKPASGLTVRTKSAMHSPGAVAARAARAR